MKMMVDKPKLVYLANRRIGLRCLGILLEHDWKPSVLLVPEGSYAECAGDMRALVPEIPIIEGRRFLKKEILDLLQKLEPHYLVSVHFPYVIPEAVLRIPSIGALNLHPAYLPYNRGWHTPSWAIYEGTPYGATLHWMDAGLDTGDIALRRAISVLPQDTAHSLYQRVLELEEALFREAVPLMLEGSLPRQPQETGGTSHTKAELNKIQRLDLDESMSVRKVIDRLRALTTSRWDEAAYFEHQGNRYRVRVEIRREDRYED